MRTFHLCPNALNASTHDRVAYSPDACNSLPSLHAASGQLRELDGESIVSGPIRQLFLNHGVHERFGVILLHKHLDIRPTERLVEYGYTSNPWDVGDATSHIIDKYEGTILPRSFWLMERNFVPYEFGYFHSRPHPTFGGEGDVQFLKEFSSFLAKHQLDRVLSFRDLD